MTSGIPKLEILIGLPGSGKSTYAKEEHESIPFIFLLIRFERNCMETNRFREIRQKYLP